MRHLKNAFVLDWKRHGILFHVFFLLVLQKEKEKNEALTKEYGFCMIDNHKEKVGNYRIEPPGLFRGRGEHPKMGCLKRRVLPEDVIINCSSKDVAPRPPAGHKWKEVRHDNKVRNSFTFST